MRKKVPLFLTLIVLTASLNAQQFNTDSLLRELPNAKNDTNKVTLLRNIGVSLAHQNPRKAIEYWKQGVALSRTLDYNMGLARCYINIATGYSFLGKYDSADIYTDTAIIYTHKTRDVHRLALIYLNKADGLRSLGDFKRALMYCDTALVYAEKAKNTDRLARIYDIISDIYAVQRNFTQSITYLDKALELYKQDENTLMVGQVFSDYADIYQQMNQHNKAIAFYKQAIHIADSVQDLKNLSTYYADLCNLYVSQGKYKDAEEAAARSLRYATAMQNSVQLATIHNQFAFLKIRQQQFNEAVRHASQAYQFAVSEDNLVWQKEASAALSEAYAGLKNYDSAYRFLSLSKKLNDSLMRMRFDETLANLQTSFDVKQKDKEIQLLSKDNELQQQQLLRQRLFLIGSVVLALLALAGIGLLISRYRLRQRIKEMQLRNQIAADLHDEVGSSLSSIHMLSVMATTQKDNAQKEILHKVHNYTRETMDKMSDIVWMIKPVEQENTSLKERMERFMYEMCSSQSIRCTLEEKGLDDVKLGMQHRKALYLVFKEAMNNAVKYADATHIAVKIQTENGRLRLIVKDDGKGFAIGNLRKGNGLDNMQTRAEELGGQLTVQSIPGGGTTISLSLPV